ncbi:BnaC09g20420D [Brassica napus]|uniref:BnaC09g20420D protein n=1 Tax=Brassica napus TaxID=3708 RepID=A0A078GHL2_BRANA|nr:BnaC09g20420D [Brassica napus]
MASPSAVSEDRKSDDLEIVSVGDLYSGSCAKKYWSSSRNFCLISFFFIREKIVSLILWAIKLFELTMGAHIIWRLKKVLKYLCFCSNSALILWKIVSCAALRTSKRGMAVATHAPI